MAQILVYDSIMTKQHHHIYQVTLEDAHKLAEQVAAWVQTGTAVLLWGDLGAGKTTFSRFFIQSLCPEVETVPSPTFTLVEVYDSFKGPIWHCDLYRLKSSNEVFQLGVEEAFYDAICLIEWPERLDGILPDRRLEICFQIVDQNTRSLILKFHGFSHDDIPTFA